MNTILVFYHLIAKTKQIYGMQSRRVEGVKNMYSHVTVRSKKIAATFRKNNLVVYFKIVNKCTT